MLLYVTVTNRTVQIVGGKGQCGNEGWNVTSVGRPKKSFRTRHCPHPPPLHPPENKDFPSRP